MTQAAKKEVVKPEPFQSGGNIDKPRVKKTRGRKYNSGPKPFGGELAAQWLEHMRVHRYSERTIWSCKSILGQLGLFLEPRGRKAAVEVEAEDLTDWMAALAKSGMSKATIMSYTHAVRRWFTWLEENGQLFLNPAAHLVLHRDDGLKPAPTLREVLRLLSAPPVATALGVRDRAIMETAYATGTRREELITLDLFDVDLERGTARVVGKGRKERVLPLTKTAVKWLTHYVRSARPKLLAGRLDEPALWIDRTGKRMDGQTLHVMIRKYARSVGLKDIGVHALRRACATHLLENGAHPLQVQTLLGHGSFGSLKNYLRLTAKEVRAMHRKAKPGQ